jgi:hypothetical protein
MQITAQVAKGITDAPPVLGAELLNGKGHALILPEPGRAPMMVTLHHVLMAAADTGPALVFVIAMESDLPGSPCSRDDLGAAQQLGPNQGFALRLFTGASQQPDDLVNLPLDGRLTGEDRRAADGQQLICDAVLPRYAPDRHWLGVYTPASGDAGVYICLDRFALEAANNETCWFYPTHDGNYLSWERDLHVALQPGIVVDPSSELLEAPYERDRISLLWSLLKDDDSLTSVGLTYGGQRIEWCVQTTKAEPLATWSSFRVDSRSTPSLVVAGQAIVRADRSQED